MVFVTTYEVKGIFKTPEIVNMTVNIRDIQFASKYVDGGHRVVLKVTFHLDNHSRSTI
jgi:hypothetical protein